MASRYYREGQDIAHRIGGVGAKSYSWLSSRGVAIKIGGIDRCGRSLEGIHAAGLRSSNLHFTSPERRSKLTAQQTFPSLFFSTTSLQRFRLRTVAIWR